MTAKVIRIACKGAEAHPYYQLKPFQGNLKTLLKEDYERLKRNIIELGFSEPISIWKQDGEKFILNGHQRLRTVKTMVENEGYKCPNLPVSVIEAKSYQEAKRKVLSLTSQVGTMTRDGLHEFLHDMDITQQELQQMFRNPDVDLGSYCTEYYEHYPIDQPISSFGVAKIENGGDDEKDADDVPDQADPRCKKGDLWALGPHRLYCGDATDLKAVSTLMGGEMADLIITDPPYNVDYTGKTKDALKIENDKKDADAFYQFLKDAFDSYFSVTKEGSPIYVFHADTEGLNFRKAFQEAGYKLAQCLVWVKDTMVMGRRDYHWKHEPILYGWREGARHIWESDRKQVTVWNFDRPKRNAEHPTMKPIKLLEYPIKNSSKFNALVVDFFGGSGSTLIACEKMKRRCYTMELDPKYCDVILKRYEEFTGVEPKKLPKKKVKIKSA